MLQIHMGLNALYLNAFKNACHAVIARALRRRFWYLRNRNQPKRGTRNATLVTDDADHVPVTPQKHPGSSAFFFLFFFVANSLREQLASWSTSCQRWNFISSSQARLNL